MSKRSRQHRAAQARRNGAQSQGPVTAQGKAVSALNAVSHALSSRRPLLLHDENRADYDDLRRAYHLQFLPHNAVELDLVDLLVHSIWQLRRCQTAETALLDLEIDRLLPETSKIIPDIDPAGLLALAIKNLADNSHALELLRRYQSAHERTYRRTLDTLRKLRPEPAPAEPETALEPAPYPAETTQLVGICGTNPAPPPELPHTRQDNPSAAPRTALRPAARPIEFPGAPPIQPFVPKSDPESEAS